MSKRPYLNIGCGSVFHQEWENIDLIADSPHVRQHDLSTGLPYADRSFDAVYASHVLEHIPHGSVPAFLAECTRVARPGAVIRLVVPDFENMARRYLACLEQATSGDRTALARHEWMVIEIIDQAVRTRNGGLMKEFILTHAQDPVLQFVLDRVGQEACVVLNEAGAVRPSLPLTVRIRLSYRFAAQKLLEGAARLLRGRGGREAVRQGFLRTSGEIHQWIYDRVSLQQLLEKHCGQISKQDAFTSAIPGFSSYGLDVRNGAPRKPDSLYMEGIRN